jgi:hypothetical protein
VALFVYNNVWRHCRSACIERHEGKCPLERPRRRCNVTIKMDLFICGEGIDCVQLARKDLLAGSCEHNHMNLRFQNKKDIYIIDQLSDYQFLKTDSPQ